MKSVSVRRRTAGHQRTRAECGTQPVVADPPSAPQPRRAPVASGRTDAQANRGGVTRPASATGTVAGRMAATARHLSTRSAGQNPNAGITEKPVGTGTKTDSSDSGAGAAVYRLATTVSAPATTRWAGQGSGAPLSESR
uniref:HrpO n=1 Tax=Dickeya chrysanthemi TaxID=556 RepID=Q84BB1_DICCH|nr:HrpO [Dickeya chrysanthemi]